jgi:hypothetical protein
MFPEMPTKVTGFTGKTHETPWLIKQVSHTIADGRFIIALESDVNGDVTTKRRFGEKRLAARRSRALWTLICHQRTKETYD